MQNLKFLLEKLLKSKVDFVLIGGFAGVAYGSTLVTQDLDICAAITEENVKFLREALADIHPRHRMNPNFKPSFMDYPAEIKGVNNIYLETDLGVLDILSEAPPAGQFEEIKARAFRANLYGHSCKIIAIDDLIKIKETMKRPKDISALEELKLIQAKTQKK